MCVGGGSSKIDLEIRLQSGMGVNLTLQGSKGQGTLSGAELYPHKTRMRRVASLSHFYTWGNGVSAQLRGWPQVICCKGECVNMNL